VEEVFSVKEALVTTLKAKWAESTSGPDFALPEIMESAMKEFRPKLMIAQGACQELGPLLKALSRLLCAARKDSVKEAQEMAKDYRQCPVDGILERKVSVARSIIWVPVMPKAEMGEGEDKGKTWRRWAFEMAHCTFLEPHRPSGPTWQTLKRIAFWHTMHKDFTEWLFVCAVCQQAILFNVCHVGPEGRCGSKKVQ
jgi:hypothetical protein